MVRTKYNCQVCGIRTKRKFILFQGDLPALTCQVCQRDICYKCSTGGFCRKCFELFPDDIRKPYEKKAKIFKIFTYLYLSIVFLACALLFAVIIALIRQTKYEELAMYSFFVSMALFGYVLCPGLIIQSIVNSIEYNHSDGGAMRLIDQHPKKEILFK